MDRLADRRAGRAMREVEGEAAEGPVAGAGGLYKLVRAVFLVALAVAAFVLTGRLIDARAPLHVPLLSVKWAHFMAHRDEYTTVYIGTSVVRHHIVPEVVDAEMRARGVRERSFNLGMSHMTYSEARLLVERLLALRPARLRRVVLDAHLFLDANRANDLSPRHLWWHTPGETLPLLERLYRWKGKRERRNARLKVEAQAMLMVLTAAGRLAERFRAGWDPKLGVPDEDDVAITQEGYQALDTMFAPAVVRQRRKLQRNLMYFERMVGQRRRDGKTRKLGRRERAALDDLVRQVATAGWQPVVLETSSLRRRYEFSATVRRLAIVLSFNDPERYPELYAAEARHDYNHLNDQAARTVSLLLGDLFAAALGPGAREPVPQLRHSGGRER